MTDHDFDDAGHEADLARLLSREAVWVDPDEDVEDAIVAAIAAEAGPAPARRSGTRRAWRWVAPAAAAVVLAIAGIAVLVGDPASDPAGVDVALAGTELALEASAVATVADTPQGTRIDLDVSDLAPAGDGRYYEAWLWNDEDDVVSAGSFHLRGGDGSIELWAGVTLDDYPRMTVTLQTEGQGTVPSGETVLRSE